jgi:hypothetical protein
MLLQSFKMSMTTLLMLCALNPRWQRVDHGDELPRVEHPDLELHSEMKQLQHIVAQQTEDDDQPLGQQSPAAAAAAARAAAAAAAAARDQAAAVAPTTPPPGAALKRVASVKAAASLGAAAADEGDALGAAAARDGKPKRQPMTGASPVHLAVKDSILTENKDWGLKRHEGILNLCVVVLLATNLR